MRYRISPITVAEIPAYQALRLAGLRDHPEAFGETADHFLTVTKDQIALRLQNSESRGGFILGAFLADGTLCGVVGLARQEGEKMEHRGMVWGMYVARLERGQGLGRALMNECVARARTIPGLEQLHLSVITENIPAYELYRSMGFESYGRDPAALKIGSVRYDEHLMFKMLADSE